MKYALYNLNYLEGTFSKVSELALVKRYVYAAAGVDDTCEFPNIVYKGWCSHGNEKWQTDFCPWSPAMYEEFFGQRAAARLVFLRWQVERGDFSDDMERWKP